MLDLSEFESISPYTDEEAVVALGKLADHPLLSQFSCKFFPDQSPDFLKGLLKNITSIDEFQVLVMSKFVEWVLEHTVNDFTCDGISNIDPEKRFLALSNHRDIIFDPAITQLVLFRNGIPLTEIAVGDNLVSSPTIEYLLRSNRMIKVIRGISARELYLSSQLLSKYIRINITNQRSSIWLAQRQGRTKNGYDITEQGLLKMLDMSGKADFQTNFEELNIIPMSVSYEFEPCDILKAVEIYISRRQKYVKAEGEDLKSILTGIMQPKGRVHIQFNDPVSEQEVLAAAELDKNERFKALGIAMDRKIIANYKLWPNNYIAYDMLNGEGRFADKYTTEEKVAFEGYLNAIMQKVDKMEVDKAELKEILLGIYANPVVGKKNLE
mgnify:CR=1 FL=1